MAVMAVMSDARTGFFRRGLLVLLALTGILSRLVAADTNTSAPTVNDSEMLRASQQIREQLRQTQLAIEQNRLEAETQAASNASAFAGRLDVMEKGLAAQRLKDISGIEQAENRTILLAGSAFVCITLLVLVVASYFQWNAVNRLAAATASLSVARSAPPFTMDEAHSPPSQLMVQSGARFLEVIERLEQRIRQIETSSSTSRPSPEFAPGNGASVGVTPKALTLEAGEMPARIAADRVSLLVGKSQTLMKIDKLDAALRVLDEALTIEPENADAFIKKGVALERLHRVDEAVRCFDRAIDIDPSITMAYLYKGALFNRMERYNEALACYEQALKTNEKVRPSDLTIPAP
jgi:tetratricopeptide (TPR) repeat protein